MRNIAKNKNVRQVTVLVLSLFLLVWTTTIAWGAEDSIAIVTGKLVNIRTEPSTSTSATIITQVPKGEELSVLDNQQGWYRVKTKSGQTGWISGDYIQVKMAPSANNQQQVPPQEVTKTPAVVVKVMVDGKVVDFDIPPYIDAQNRTMVPIRFVATELGSQVFWKAEEQLITITSEGQIIQLWIGHAMAKVNGLDVALDTTPVLKDGRTMVPLRFVGDSLGVQVDWDGAANTVVLTTKKPTPEIFPPGKDSLARVALITGNAVRIRSGPGTEYEIITQVNQGDALMILGEADGWYQVQSKEGYQGWVANWLVAVRTDPNTSSRSPDPGERARPAPPLYTGPNILKDILVRDLGDKLEVIIAGQHALNYTMMGLSNPQRVVLDFYNTTLDLGWDSDGKMLTHNELASGLRVGQFTDSQARVVIDLKTVASPSVSLSEDGTQLVLKLQPPSIKGKIVVIDPGHGSIQPGGWSDPGAISPLGLYERDVVTDIAWKLHEILKREGATVIMTRTGDTTNLDLAGRAQIANESKADIFVSIHANSSTNPAIAGTSTYYYAPGESWLGAQRVSRQRLANFVQQELVAQLGRRNIGIIESNFAVLRETTVPSILVETAFLSNPEEGSLLASEEFRAKAAEGIANGIMRYFAEP